MKRLSLALLVLLAACGDRDAAADNLAADDVETLPADESAGTPTNDLANGAATAPVDPATGNPQTAIPAALHGRWGLTAEDCLRGRSDAKGLVSISADAIRFYESVARPAQVLERSETRIRGEFAFTGEGMSWTGPMIWSVAGDKLTRIDSEGDSRLVYTRCPM